MDDQIEQLQQKKVRSARKHCARCLSEGTPLRESSNRGRKKLICVNEKACRERRKKAQVKSRRNR